MKQEEKVQTNFDAYAKVDIVGVALSRAIVFPLQFKLVVYYTDTFNPSLIREKIES